MKTVHFFAVLLVLLLANCSKEVDFTEVDPAYDHYWNIKPRSVDQKSTYVADLFQRHLSYYQGSDPMQYLPGLVREQFVAQLTAARTTAKNVGFSAYLQDGVATEELTAIEAAVFEDIYQKIQLIPTVGIAQFEQDVASAYADGVSIAREEELSAYHLYKIMQLAAAWYQENNYIDVRDGDCSIVDFFQNLISSAQSGNRLAKQIIEFLGLEDPDGFFGEAGEVIADIVTYLAPAVSVIVEIVEWVTNKDCDDLCIPITSLSIVYDNTQDCAMTRTIRAFNESEAAQGYTWLIQQGSNSDFEETPNPMITLTQNDPNTPMLVRARPNCVREDSQVPEFFEQVIDLAPSGPLGEVGGFQVIPEITSQQYTHDDMSTFIYGASNYSSGNIVYTIDLPSNLGQVVDAGDNYTTIKWGGYGVGVVTFTATNVCSGAQSSHSMNIQVSF